MRIKKIAVIGAGAMGHGIAQVAAMAGFEVSMRDINEEVLAKAMERIKWSLGKLAEKGRIREEDVGKVEDRIYPVVPLKKAVQGVDYVIEAVPEILKLKLEIFEEIDEGAPEHAILATNTSALPVSEISESTRRMDKVVGMHFFNPAQLMRLVEIVMSEKTSHETCQVTIELTKRFGKEPVICQKDIPGFIANRITIAATNLVCWMVYNGEYTIEEVDAAMIQKAGMPMGVFALMDYTGIDVAGHVLKFMAERESHFEACPLMLEKLEKGNLGYKTGKGFYTYPEKGQWVMPKIDLQKAEKFDPMTQTYVSTNMAAELIRNKVATIEDIDKTMKLGFNMPMGVLELADIIGIDTVVSKLKEFEKKYGPYYRPSPLLEKMVEKKELGTKSEKGFYKY